ncbi:MAG: Asp23/Gls24 family envelope stress response protein [Oscillospiraceae bacterium]|jgi:uncharacterized alkaline shock family protein YloU|nr:Asp23/Gls24 family envelope stress response protein [Oscillospiraceae bacterium]
MITQTNEQGTITISKDVFTTLAGEAATNCFGVKGMVVRSAADGLLHLLRREAMGKGVLVRQNDDDTVSIELHIAVDRDVNISTLCESIQTEVRYKVESASGVTVSGVDVYVDSMIIG